MPMCTFPWPKLMLAINIGSARGEHVFIIAAAAREPVATERGSTLISTNLYI